MNLVPLVARELRTAIRRPAFYRLRWWSGVGAMALAFAVLFIWSAWAPLAVGRSFLLALATTGFAGALLSGVVLIADSVSSEKREGTLPFLFLTGLSAGEVVLGKLASKAFLPLYSMIAVAPILSLSVLVGGTTLGEFIRTFLLWANTLFLALAASLLVSTFCWKRRSAHLLAGALLLLLTATIPLLSEALSRSTGMGIWHALGLLISPAGPFQLTFDQDYQAAPIRYWMALTANFILGCGCLVLARARLVRVRFQDANDEAARSARAKRRSFWTSKRPPSALLEIYPLEWLEVRRTSRVRYGLIWSIAAGVLVLTMEIDPLGGTRVQLAFLVFLLLQAALKVWVAMHATYAFANDRQSGALESLLATRLDVREVTHGMLRGYVRRFGLPVTIMFVLDLFVAFRLLWQGAVDSSLVVWAAVLMVPIDCYCAGILPRASIVKGG